MFKIIFQFFLFLFWSLPLPAKPFIEGKITGQLGNQMFQVAATTSLALDNGAEAIFPGLKKKPTKSSELNLKYVFSRVNTQRTKKKVKFRYDEPHFHYAEIPYKPDMKIRGLFQSEKYFKHHRKEILNLFKPLPETITTLWKKFPEVINHPNSVAVHVRTFLPDYPYGSNHFIFLGWEYYEEVIQSFPSEALFVICSDRIDLCKEHLSHIDRNIIFSEDNPPHEDLYLMSMCKHNIISNSSFSWWAAWLNQNPGKIVIAPPVWFATPQELYNTKDVIPEDWVIYSK